MSLRRELRAHRLPTTTVCELPIPVRNLKELRDLDESLSISKNMKGFVSKRGNANYLHTQLSLFSDKLPEGCGGVTVSKSVFRLVRRVMRDAVAASLTLRGTVKKPAFQGFLACTAVLSNHFSYESAGAFH